MALTQLDLAKQAKDGSLTPSKISTNPADTYAFPGAIDAKTGLLQPLIDSTTAFQVKNASGSESNLFIVDSTNLGVGIRTAPGGFTLNVNGSTFINGNLVTPTLLGNSSLHISPQADTVNAIRFSDTGGSNNILSIDALNKRVGVNTTTPVADLDINGVVNIATSLVVPLINDAGAVIAIDILNRYLKDSSNVISLDWLNRLLKASDGTPSINFNTPGTVDVTATLDMSGNPVIHLPAPVNPTDAATKDYVDTVAQGLTVKAACAAATVGNLSVTAAGSQVGKTLTATANGALIVDGYTALLNDRILVKDQTAGVDNGIYTVTQTGDAGNPFILTRATDFDNSTTVHSGDFTFINNGTVNASSGWVLSTPNPIVVDTTSLTFTQFSSTGTIVAGNGLTKTGNTLDVHPSDASLEVHVGDINVLRDPAGAIGLSVAGIAANVTNNIHIVGNALDVVASPTFTGLTINGDLNTQRVLPITDNTYDLGSASNNWANVFISGGIRTGNNIDLLNPAQRKMYDNASVLSLDWGVRHLVDNTGATIVNWSVNGTLSVPATINTNKVVTPAIQITTAPTAGYVLTSDASGNGTWQATATPITFVTREVPTGVIDGVNVTFTLANTPTAGSEEVFQNGLLQNVGALNDYTISGATITFNSAPTTGDVILVNYRF